MNNVWKEFDLMWGLAPPESLKFKKAQEVIAFIRKNFIERSEAKQEKLEIIEHLEDQFRNEDPIDRETFDLCIKHLKENA